MLKLVVAFFFSTGLALIPLASCGTTPAQQVGSVVGASPEQVQAVLNTAKKGMTAAHDAHGFAADFSLSLVHTGVLHGENAARVSTLLKQSEDALKVGDAAIAVGDAQGALDAIDKANALTAQVRALLPSS